MLLLSKSLQGGYFILLMTSDQWAVAQENGAFKDLKINSAQGEHIMNWSII